jgi:hypothetical protein
MTLDRVTRISLPSGMTVFAIAIAQAQATTVHARSRIVLAYSNGVLWADLPNSLADATGYSWQSAQGLPAGRSVGWRRRVGPALMAANSCFNRPDYGSNDMRISHSRLHSIRQHETAPAYESSAATPRGTFGVIGSSEDATFFHSHTRSVPHEVSQDPIQLSRHRRSRGAKVLPPDYSGTFGRYSSKTR